MTEAHAALGRIYLYYEWDWEAAERTFKYVNKKNPSMATNHYHYAWYLHLMGRKKEALTEHELAQHLDPLGPKNTAWLAWLYADYGEFEKAEKEVKKTFELSPDYAVGFLAEALIKEKQGKPEEAIDTYKRLVALYPHHKGLLGCAYIKAGYIEEGKKIISTIEQEPSSPWKAMQLATLYSVSEDFDKAIKWLKFKPHHAYVPWSRVVTNFYPMRSDPRFHQLLEEMGLPPLPKTNE